MGKSLGTKRLELGNILEMLERSLPPGEMERVTRYQKRKAGRPWKASVWEIIRGMVVHMLGSPGTFGDHFAEANGKRLAESSLSERRRKLPWQIFSELMALLLRPLGDKERHRDAFYKNLRLVAVDGSQFSLRNCEGILRYCTKSVSRRFKAAFAKVKVSVLVELGLHNPLAAEIARHGESEWELSLRLLRKLPQESLLLADRLYGCPAFIKQLRYRARCKFLIRIRKNALTQRLQRLTDGSSLVEIRIRTSRRHKVRWKTEVREITASVGRRGHRAQRIRLWTNLLDEKRYPASELIELYSKRWQHELYYREIKSDIQKEGELLQSQTFETACQEIAALLLATSVVAEHRASLAAAIPEATVTMLGFRRALFYTQHLWFDAMCWDGIVTLRQRKQAIQRLRNILAPEKVPKKRSRSCPRAVRQPVKGWPRKLNQESQEENWQIKIF
jgi:hypothetical protein